MRRRAVDASREHLAETCNISRSLVEKAMYMRCESYFADAKSSLLTQTIFEIEDSKKNILKKNRILTKREKLIKEKNQYLEQKVLDRTRELTQANHELSILNRSNQLQLREKDAMLREIHHRVRNNLQVVISLLRMQSRSTRSQKFKSMASDCEQRIMALASIHEELYRSDNLSNIKCQGYFTKISNLLLKIYHTKNVAIHVDAHGVDLSISNAIPCGQIFHELISNALKYAFPGNRHGLITVSLMRHATGMTFTIADNGIGLPPEFDLHAPGKMGLELVKLLIEQLDGTMEASGNGGTRFMMRFKIDEASIKSHAQLPSPRPSPDHQ